MEFFSFTRQYLQKYKELECPNISKVEAFLRKEIISELHNVMKEGLKHKVVPFFIWIKPYLGISKEVNIETAKRIFNLEIEGLVVSKVYFETKSLLIGIEFTIPSLL